ncbi:MAG UNVERIFIED_CONTAM: hypothetical protein LVT10_16150 [Anaerolineae bacterium]|jgi:hypothetical protein
MSLSNHPFHTDPLVDIVAFLLKQLRRPLLAHGLPPSDGEERGWAQRLIDWGQHRYRVAPLEGGTDRRVAGE